MIEKYAVDLKAIPPTDDQIRTIKRLTSIYQKQASVNEYLTVEIPATSEDAEKLIKQLEDECDE